MVRPCSTSQRCFVRPGSVRTTLAAPFGDIGGSANCDSHFGLAARRASIDAGPLYIPVTCPRPADVAPRCTCLWVHLGETIGARTGRPPVADMSARSLQVRDAPDVGNPTPCAISLDRQAEVGIAVSTATDVAKGAASVRSYRTGPSRTSLGWLSRDDHLPAGADVDHQQDKPDDPEAAFVAIAFVLTGKFVVSAFAMLLLVFLTDFAKIALATDHVRSSRKPETWNIGGFITVVRSAGRGNGRGGSPPLVHRLVTFRLATNDNALYTFSFLTLLYLAVFSIVSARERRWFWATMPSKTLMVALALDALVGTGLTLVGLPGLIAIALVQPLTILAYAMVSCLVVNDAVKVAMIRWRVPMAVTENRWIGRRRSPNVPMNYTNSEAAAMVKRIQRLDSGRAGDSEG